MIAKTASFKFTDINPLFNVQNDGNKMVRTASGRVLIEPGSEKEKIVQSAIKKHPNALFFRAKAIEADEPNTNGDYFSVEELEKSYKSFEGVPFFTNHDNQNVENARGKVIFAEWVPQEKAVYTICFIDRDAYPHICRSIEEEYVTGVSMGAISGDATITMADLSFKNIADVKVDDNVLTPYGNIRKVIKTHCDNLSVDMIHVDVGNFAKLPLFTEDHPIYIVGKDNVEKEKAKALKEAQSNKYLRRMGKTDEFIGQDGWRSANYKPSFVEAAQVSEGDYALIPSRHKMVCSNILSENSDLAYLYGLYLGDGYVKLRYGKIEGFGLVLGADQKDDVLKRVLDIFKKVSTHEPSIEEKRGAVYVYLYDRVLANLLNDKFGNGSHVKRVKDSLLSASEIDGIISGYIDTDGCRVKNYVGRGRELRGFQISSCNKSLLEDIQSLLILLGATSYIKTTLRTPCESSVVDIETVEHTLFIGLNDATLLKSSLKINKENISAPQIKAGKSFILRSNGNSYLACPVKAVKKVEYLDPVFDLTVEGDECYIANGVAVHNCSVEYSVCNLCGNKAERTEDYCTHIRNRKGRKFSGRVRNIHTGEEKIFKDEPVFEFNHGLKFIELSAVVDPACPNCHIEGIIPNDNYLSKVASMENEFRLIRTAAIEKEASQEEIDQIEQCLGTLEQIAVNLIQNRQQVEMEFSSDLVKIMSDLQTWLEELVGAGYGNIGGGEVPGTVGNVDEMGGDPSMGGPMPEGSMEGGAPMGGAPAPTPVASETAMDVGSVSGSPKAKSNPMPNLPITAPVKPRTSGINDSRSIQRVSDMASDQRISKGQDVIRHASEICERLNKTGGEAMGSRRTASEKQSQKEQAIEILSNSWKEKQEFFEYIKQLPSIQNNEHRLSVNKRDDSFIIVAEDKSSDATKVWTYEDLTESERQEIINFPKDAAIKLLDTFANNLNTKNEGVNKMTYINKVAGATTSQETPNQVQEGQLDRSDLYHARQNDEKHETTQKQLESLRNGESNEVTEGQLDDSGLKLNPRQNKVTDQVQEGQLADGTHTGEEKHTITQKQLSDEGHKVGNEQNTVTEDQLNQTPAPWARSATRDASLFKSASEHMNAVKEVLADTAIKTGCTPEETCTVAASLVESLENRYNLGVSLAEDAKSKEDINFAKRIAYWQNKNLRVASTSTKEIAEVLVDGLRRFASDETYNPDVIIDAVDIISEDEIGAQSVSDRIEEKIKETEDKPVEAKKSRKEELRMALKSKKQQVTSSKQERDSERNKILASVQDSPSPKQQVEEDASSNILNPSAIKNADTVIETSFGEMDISKKANKSDLKREIRTFAKGALATQNLRLASITNVTINGDTIQIAVQTDTEENEVNIDTGDGDTEIPIGGQEPLAPAPQEQVPEGDMSGEGLGENMGQQSWASSKKGNRMKREAQAPMGGSVGGEGGPAMGAPEQGLPGGAPTEGDAVQALTVDTGEESEIPTAGERQMPWTICPECGSTDVDVSNEGGNITGSCNACSAEYEALIKKEIEFKIIKPTKSVGEEGAELPEEPEAPEVPALPVAAQTNLGKDAIIRIAKNQKENGNVCPSCGHKHCTASKDKNGHTEFKCNACGTSVEKDLMVSASNPEKGVLRVQWDVFPDADCADCLSEASKFASQVKASKMLRTASAKKDEFPTSACMERLARKYGGDTVATFGPCKGKLLAECVCGQLQKLGFRKIRQMNRLASASLEQDPWDECIEDQTKNEGLNLTEAEALCGCIKKKFASGLSDNIYVQAFAEDIANGVEKDFNMQDLQALDDLLKEEEANKREAIQQKLAQADEADISSALPELDSIEVEADVEDEIVEASETSEKLDVEAKSEETLEAVSSSEKDEDTGEETDEKDEDEETDEDEKNEKTASTSDQSVETEEDKQIALAMNGRRIRNTNEEVFKMASNPKQIDSIEGNVEAGVPRSKATIRNEGADNIDVSMASPNVPRGNAEMGNEGANNVNPKAGLPDVAVDSSYMGREKEIQKNMPAINNEIKGTVIAEDGKSKRQAKQLKEVDSVEDDVEAGVPRGKATMGNEGADNIDVSMASPDVPRSNAEMGNEGSDNINPKADGPDVPVGKGAMGNEKEIQKDMPAINEKMLKQVEQKRQNQMDKIAQARKNEAVQTTAWLVANNRIGSDKGTFDTVVTALSGFETDQISKMASVMFPERNIKTSSANPERKAEAGHGIPAIVQESAPMGSDGEDLMSRLANSFTIGNTKFDKDLTIYGER